MRQCQDAGRLAGPWRPLRQEHGTVWSIAEHVVCRSAGCAAGCWLSCQFPGRPCRHDILSECATSSQRQDAGSRLARSPGEACARMFKRLQGRPSSYTHACASHRSLRSHCTKLPCTASQVPTLLLSGGRLLRSAETATAPPQPAERMRRLPTG